MTSLHVGQILIHVEMFALLEKQYFVKKKLIVFLRQDTRHKTMTEPVTDRRTSNGHDRPGTNTARPQTPEGATSSRDGGAEVPASETATNKTTLEDLMETLKKLEEEDVVSTSTKTKNQKPLDWREFEMM